jgi:hypothetical protein
MTPRQEGCITRGDRQDEDHQRRTQTSPLRRSEIVHFRAFSLCNSCTYEEGIKTHFMLRRMDYDDGRVHRNIDPRRMLSGSPGTTS